MEDSANIDEFLGSEELPIPVEGEGDPIEDLGDQEQSSEQNGDNKDRDKERRGSARRERRRSSPRRSRSRSRSRDRDRSRKRFVTVSSTRVVVKNMPYELKWQDIKDLFRKEVGDVAYVEMIEGNDGKPRGIAVLEFKDKDAARKAIETMHQYKIHDRYLVVHEEREKDRRMFQQSMNNRDGGGMDGRGMDGRGGGMGDMRGGMGPGAMGLGAGVGLGMGMGGGMMNNMAAPGISPEVLAQLGIDGPISPQVFVANLDYKVTTSKLREVFRLAGNVTKTEIKEDKNGKSRGMGIVQFEQPLEAVQAISMFNNQTLYDRRMIVRMDKVPEDITPPNKLPSGLKSIGMGLGLGGSPLTNMHQMNSAGSSLGMGGGLGGGGLGAVGLGGGLGAGAGLGLGMDSGLGVGGLGVAAGLSGISGLGSGGLGSGLGGSGLGGLGGGLGKLGGLEGAHGMGMDSGMMGGGGGGYGGSNDRGGRREERGQRFTRPDNCTVQVKNLPYSVTWQDLRERFLEIGEVKYAEIKMEKGRSTGQGLVRFSTEDDAIRAINSMDRTRFEGRTIDVQMYRG
ncbi:myelin expression factor 2-like [Babylonia areolata]|uniref:myelin expression factor 2-like n=1 Tax=Babylonia areolata TaxID=304850 RepID=UPI003FD03AC0